MAKRKRSETVRIGSLDYDLLYKDKIVDETNTPLNGFIGFVKPRILLTKEMSKQKSFEVLMHECIHGFLYTAGVEIPNDEKIVLPLGPIFASFLRDNIRLLIKKGDLL